MGVSMSTLAGWVVVLGLFGVLGYREFSTSQRIQSSREQQRSRLERQAAGAQKGYKKAKQQKESKPKPATQGTLDAKPKPPSPAPAQAAPAYNYSSDDRDADRDRDAARNREFARQLNSVKQGTKFTGKAKEESRQKSVKQSRAEEAPVAAADAGGVSAASSTAGIDADDDNSSAATSPVLAAATQAGAVDDMLEKAAPGPSVLRLTGTEEKPNYKTQKTKAPEVVESKKQRQNRKKAELAKAEREAAESDRKVKLEAQRRTARQAEGRAAKDGSAFMVAQAASNAWTGQGTSSKTASSGGPSGTNGFVPAQPLDTFDANVQTDASKSSVPSYDKSEDWMSSLPSEEEQMEILRKDQNEDSWNTVTKGRKNKKTKDAAPAAEAPAAAAAPAAPTPAATKAAPAAAATPAPGAQKPRPAAAVASQSSFAALTVDEPAEEQEEEWDV
ncbi:hypothetical protein HMPREF1624_08099 [Sporothrix schenckii ATCC 58251]|uniref:Uncharacterized protein n=1 Tax=Sporothrix schenckii (strain ATCC 58251 / de Perez 2211183) TaxID=1391915 RepID=U7PIX3_SPOS1|nr:hypothetical protein HMPREF1624_08099 [Sporothrix schenckii ATCC 58251]